MIRQIWESDMSDDFTPQEQVAYPFLEAAVRIDTAKQNPTDKELLARVLDDNVALGCSSRIF